uniref:Uncharacterized protein n=1 Tax=Cacopsylla melanoneura TaxID=428564 RepID=A0A8D8R2P3_9HEMI
MFVYLNVHCPFPIFSPFVSHSKHFHGNVNISMEMDNVKYHHVKYHEIIVTVISGRRSIMRVLKWTSNVTSTKKTKTHWQSIKTNDKSINLLYRIVTSTIRS